MHCNTLTFGCDETTPGTGTGCWEVDPEGLEPSTFSMPLRRAPNCAMGPQCGRYFTILAMFCPPGGPGGIRTRDLFSAIEARSQLRYRPSHQAVGIVPERRKGVKKTQQSGGLEKPTAPKNRRRLFSNPCTPPTLPRAAAAPSPIQPCLPSFLQDAPRAPQSKPILPTFIVQYERYLSLHHPYPERNLRGHFPQSIRPHRPCSGR